jgi:hypothetical protein
MLTLSKGPNRVDAFPLTLGWKQFQFPKGNVLYYLTIAEDGQASNCECGSKCYALSNLLLICKCGVGDGAIWARFSSG